MKKTLVLLAVTLMVGCGGSGGGGSNDGPSGPGTLSLKIENLTGAQGKILVVFAYAAGSRIDQSTAGLCTSITTDPFSITDTMKGRLAGSSTPCELETTTKVLDAGNYNLALQTFVMGEMSPDQCATTTATVKGDIMVTAPALGACP